MDLKLWQLAGQAMPLFVILLVPLIGIVAYFLVGRFGGAGDMNLKATIRPST